MCARAIAAAALPKELERDGINALIGVLLLVKKFAIILIEIISPGVNISHPGAGRSCDLNLRTVK